MLLATLLLGSLSWLQALGQGYHVAAYVPQYPPQPPFPLGGNAPYPQPGGYPQGPQVQIYPGPFEPDIPRAPAQYVWGGPGPSYQKPPGPSWYPQQQPPPGYNQLQYIPQRPPPTRPPVQPQLPPSSPKPSEIMADCVNLLAVRVLLDHASARGNFVFSPYGATSVLCVLWEGSTGATSRQLQQALSLPPEPDTVRVGMRDLHRHLKSYFGHNGYLQGVELSRDKETSLRVDFIPVLRIYGYHMEDKKPEEGEENPQTGVVYATTTMSPDSDSQGTSTHPPELEEVTVLPEEEHHNTEVTSNTESSVDPMASTHSPESMNTTTQSTSESSKPESTTTDSMLSSKPESMSSNTQSMSDKPESMSSTSESTLTSSKPESMSDKPESMSDKPESMSDKPESMTSTSESMPVKPGSMSSTSESTLTSESSKPESMSDKPESMTSTSESMPAKPESMSSTSESMLASESSKPGSMSSTTESMSDKPESMALVSSTSKPESPSTDSDFTTPTTMHTEFTTMHSDMSTGAASEALTVTSLPDDETQTQGSTALQSDEATPSVLEENENEEGARRKRESNDKNVLFPDIALTSGRENMTEQTEDLDSDPLAPRRSFRLFSGTFTRPVPVLERRGELLPFASLPGLRSIAAMLPLDDPRYGLLVLLPTDGRGPALKQLAAELTQVPLRKVMGALRISRLHVTLPKFAARGPVVLTSSLQQLGVWDVFDPRLARFDRMSTDPGLFVRELEQTVRIDFGTARSVNTRVITARSVPEVVDLMRPFIYFVVDRETQTALLAGKVEDPSTPRIF